MSALILIVNPGSTSTKLALFDHDRCLFDEVFPHPANDLAGFDTVTDQFDYRMKAIDGWLASISWDAGSLAAVVGRGAPLRRLEGGSYKITDRMIDDLKTYRYSNHASNLGPIIARHLGERFKVPSLIADPITVDNFPDVARISGRPEIERRCRSHALNIKEVSRRQALVLGQSLTDVNFVTVHMGGGISVAALQGGKIVDVNDGLLGMGPFSPDRAGALPIGGLVELCFSGEYTQKEMTNLLSRNSGLTAYLGSSDLREVEQMIVSGNEKALLCFQAMAYQIAKEIGAAAAALSGKVENIILTGGMANSERLVNEIMSRTAFIAPTVTMPGEFEMEALASAGQRFLDGQEQLQDY